MIVTLLTIVFLIAMWVAVLAAPVLQNRGASAGRGGDSIKTFRRQLESLDRAAPAAPRSVVGRATSLRRRAGNGERTVLAPPNARRLPSTGQLAAQRRRRVLGLLLASVVTTLVAAFVLGGWFVLANLVVDAMLVGYIVLMVRTLRIHAEREMKVAFLPHRASGAEPTALLQDVARSRRA